MTKPTNNTSGLRDALRALDAPGGVFEKSIAAAPTPEQPAKQHARDSAELRRLCQERDQLRAELAAIKATREGWRLVPIEPLLNLMSDKDHDTRITAERQLLTALAAAPMPEQLQTAAARAVLAERKRQVEAEGWTPEHDDQHDGGALAAAASAYALYAADELNPLTQGSCDYGSAAPARWPFHRTWWKPDSERSALVKAAALCLAEIERMDRLPAGLHEGLTQEAGQ